MPDLPVNAAVTPERLASALAARLIHDAMGPASGIVSAFDLLADPSAGALREDALVLAAQSARALVDILTFSRTVYGGGGAPLSTDELSAAATTLFAGSRATLEQRLDPGSSSAISGRIYLGLLQLMASGAAAGGKVVAVHAGSGARAAGGRIEISIEAAGPRVALGEQVYSGLAGEPPGAGLPHAWSAAYLIGAVARSAGGGVQAVGRDGGVSLRAVISADMA